ncbi:MAG: CCA tRNA nucleotidyltransferase [Peptococcaceae bacterium]|nr:CCA tRNA nucleotidyltransferase [Peptococcaceae bacterium]
MISGGISVLREGIDPDRLPRQVAEVLDRLERNGFRAYLVGGVVRDMIMGRGPKDYDIATSATPAQVRQLFPKVAPTGEKHGTVTVFNNGMGIEVTTLRREGRYSDHRRPDSVEFTRSLKEDLSRRDFTINSLAAGRDGTVYDFFGGLEDIAAGIIRAVGDPKKRFREDALRMMRAIRFSCQTGFAVEERTLESIRVNRRLMARVSAERVREELNAILVSGLPHRGVAMICDLGLMDFILPELADWVQVGREAGRGDVIGHTLDVLRYTPARLNVRLAALLHDIGGPGCPAAEILERLKYDRRTIKSVAALVAYCRAGIVRERKEIKRVMGRLGPEHFNDLTGLWRAEARASGTPGGEAVVEGLKRTAEDILEKKEPLRLKDLAVNGHDLKALGIRPGREMGAILNGLLEAVLEDPGMNEKNRLLDLVRRRKTGTGDQEATSY